MSKMKRLYSSTNIFPGMTENPNNNANVFDPTEGNGAKVRLGSVGQSAPGCKTRLHLQVRKRKHLNLYTAIIPVRIPLMA